MVTDYFQSIPKAALHQRGKHKFQIGTENRFSESLIIHLTKRRESNTVVKGRQLICWGDREEKENLKCPKMLQRWKTLDKCFPKLDSFKNCCVLFSHDF